VNTATFMATGRRKADLPLDVDAKGTLLGVPLAFFYPMSEINARLPVFVYGTLMPGEQNYTAFLRGRTISEFPAATEGELWLDAVGDYPYLCPGRGRVHGWLITIAPQVFAVTIRAIDTLEEFFPDRPGHCLYLRKRIKVIAGQKSRPAWGYIWNQPARPGFRLASGDYSTRHQVSER